MISQERRGLETLALGIRDGGSAARAGLVHYNHRDDVDRLLTAVAELAS